MYPFEALPFNSGEIPGLAFDIGDSKNECNTAVVVGRVSAAVSSYGLLPRVTKNR